MTYQKNSEIFGEKEPADYLYKVVSGSVRTYNILSDGRRVISRFHLPGDIFGFELTKVHRLSAEAIRPTRLLAVKRSEFDACAGSDISVAQQLSDLIDLELRQVEDHALLLGRRTQERVAGFLLEMGDRLSGDEIELPMSRYDIGDYLGVTIETVSRTLTSLECVGAIKVTLRHIVLRNRSMLALIDGGDCRSVASGGITRGFIHESKGAIQIDQS
jgi:CRP/FNR family transcriptional regulator, nitrogen fixation regulation protein